MYINNLRRTIVLIGLTFTLPLGILTAPVFAQTEDMQTPGVVTPTAVTVYNFPEEEITYSTDGSFDYKGQHFQGDEISVVDSTIGKQVTVTISRGVDTLTTFTLLLPNEQINNDAKVTAVGITVNRVFPRLGTTSYTLLHGTVSSAS